MSTSWLIRNVQSMGQAEAVDVVVRDGTIDAIGPDAGADAGNFEIIDGGDRLIFPGLVDAHTHMDKTLMGLGWRRHEAGPNLLDLIENERRVRREEGIDSHQQSMRHARAAIATGTTHIRTHVDIDTEIGLKGFEGVSRTQVELADA